MAISQDIPLDAVKARCKELRMTVNEFLFGIISQTMRRCMENHGDFDTRQITVQIPISLRRPAKHPMDFELHNDISFARFKFRLVSDFKTEVETVREDLAHLRKWPVLLLGMYF